MDLLLFIQTPTPTPQPTEGEGGLAAIVVIGVMILIAVMVVALIMFAWNRPAMSRPWLDYGNFFIVAIGIVTVLLAFLVAMASAAEFFQNAAQILAILTALFGVVGTLVGTYFGVKAGSDAAEGAQKLAGGAVVPDRPAVLSVYPARGAVNVPRDVSVTATFSKDMNPDTLTELTFSLAERASGNVVPAPRPAYELPAKRAVLRPTNQLAASNAYRATITVDVRDQAGNALPEAFSWEFTTAAP